MSFLRARMRSYSFLYSSTAQTQGPEKKNVCFTVKLKKGVNIYIIKADTAELFILIAIVLFLYNEASYYI